MSTLRSKAKQDNARVSKKLKLNNKKYFLCGWNSWCMKEPVAEKPLEWFGDRLKVLLPSVKKFFVGGTHKRRGGGQARIASTYVFFQSPMKEN